MSIRSDALLLYAIAYCSHHDSVATLRGIFAACDAIDRSAPTFAELESGLGRLCAGKLLLEETDGFKPSAEGLDSYRVVNAGGGHVFERLERLEAVLGERYRSADGSRRVKLDPQAVEEARRSYYRE